ncbi:MAG: DUF1801 domain-containing protein [Pirellulaceae bacterium]|nr:DUF1801 domain-containing protein [Planctomycetales bacterium]
MRTGNALPNSIDAYISGYPQHVQDILQEIRAIVRDAAPDADEAIKYGIPTFVWNGNLVHFAAYEKHVGFYPTPSGIEHFKDELSGYMNAKGSVQFPLDAPMPFSLIKKIVKFRVKENRDKAASKSAKRRK